MSSAHAAPRRAFPPARFQSFEDKTDKANVAPRLAALRREMAKADVDGFLVPRADAHRGESVPASDARLAYVSAFTGSAGLLFVGPTEAHLLVDNRYVLQGPMQTDTAAVGVHEITPATLAAELARCAGPARRIGYDPWLHTPGEIKAFAEALGEEAELVALPNLVDRIWPDRPAPPVSEIEILGPNRTGRTTAEKLDDLRNTLAEAKADAVVLTLPESLCWLFNLRGRDVPNTPYVLGFAVVPRDGRPTLYLAPEKHTEALRSALAGLADLAPATSLAEALAALGRDNRSVWIDPATAPAAVAEALADAGARIIEKRDPVLLPKARKNPVELSGMREAQRHDAVALARFLAWFDGVAPEGGLTETAIVEALESFRRDEPSCVDVSFDTIAGSGPNGAIAHYRVTRSSDRTLTPGELMLVDSGGQYLSGTTDITRTLFTGSATLEQRDRFTRVLKGMIAVSAARFPKGATGVQIDVLARQALWQAGVDYKHGTGHGVGHFLGVHEGPISLSPRGTLPFEAGMVLSNEPGFYKVGEYGIRLENLIAVVESELGDGDFLEFETLTLVPIDTRLVEPDLLTVAERDWLNAYHARVRREIGPLLDAETRAWLERASEPV